MTLFSDAYDSWVVDWTSAETYFGQSASYEMGFELSVEGLSGGPVKSCLRNLYRVFSNLYSGLSFMTTAQLATGPMNVLFDFLGNTVGAEPWLEAEISAETICTAWRESNLAQRQDTILCIDFQRAETWNRQVGFFTFPPGVEGG